MADGPLVSEEVTALSEYLATTLDRPLPASARERAALHTLDTLAAAVSGSELEPGRMGISHATARGGPPGVASILGAGSLLAPDWAALANGMSAHADETDDSHEASWTHPGCGVVPAALAAAESNDRSIDEMLRGVAAGYDVCARVMFAIGRDNINWWDPTERNTMRSMWSTHAYGALFGATAAAAVLYGLSAREIRFALSYAVQQAAGFTTYIRDANHIEKAYVFGGMPARNGVNGVLMVQAGFDGVEDPFTGRPGFLEALSSDPQPSELCSELGERFEVERTNIKKYAVGSPAQAPVQALLNLTRGRRIPAAEITEIVIRMPADYAAVVDSRDMPDVNVQYLVAASAIEGDCTFAVAHDLERFRSPEMTAMVEKVRLVADHEMETKRQAIVELVLVGEAAVSNHVPVVRGTVADPMSSDEVVEKAHDLVDPVVGSAACDRTVDLLVAGGSAVTARQLGESLRRPG